MRIKKVLRNEYVYADDIWVRNFTKKRVKEISINEMYSENDFQLVMNNEMENTSKNELSFINDETWNFPNIVIVSDGYDFDEKHRLLSRLPKNVAIFAVNGSLKKWKLQNKDTKPDLKRSINLYIANNPYKNCIDYTHSSYFPTCVASTRVNTEFVDRYKGNKYLYVPTPEENLSSFFANNVTWHIDDYRNSVCAAVCIAFRFGVRKLLLFCCDDTFKNERPAAEQLKNGLWQYPQHRISHSIIDANLYWLSHQEGTEVVLGSHSSGKDYTYAPYISEENLKDFFVG